MKRSRLNEFIKNPRRALLILSLPVIASSIVETFYTVINAVFVGRLGADSLAAVTFAWPFFFILTALSLGLNAGIASRISRYLGERNKKGAENAVWHGLLIALVLSLVTAAIAIPSLGFVFGLTGATGAVLSMSISYMFIILLGIIFMFLSYAISSIFAAQGDTKTAMKIDAYSLILNIILAYVFIFVFNLGVNGAALAIVVSNLYALVLAIYYMYKVSYLRFRLKDFKFSSKITKEIIYVGFPSVIALLLASISAIFLNGLMVRFSVNHVALLGIVNALESISILPIYGLSVGAMTLAGMFFGARKYKLLQGMSWYAIGVGAAVSALVGIIIFIFPEQLIKLFTDDAGVIAIGVPYLKIYVIAFPLGSMVMIISRILQGMGYGLSGLIIGIARSLVISIPLAYLFVFVLHYSYLSVAIALILGALISSAIGSWWLEKRIRRL